MKIKTFIVSTFLLLGLGVFQLVAPPMAFAGLFDNAKNEACGGAQLQGGQAGCSTADTSSLDKTLSAVINILTVVVGIVAVIMIIINGLRFVTSGGDSNKVSSAKNGILWAVIGIAVVALAQFIVKFVLNRTA